MKEIFSYRLGIVLGCVLLALIFFLVAMIPFVTIWSVNQLFNLKIEYTFLNWCASCWLTAVVFRPISRGELKNDKKS